MKVRNIICQDPVEEAEEAVSEAEAAEEALAVAEDTTVDSVADITTDTIITIITDTDPSGASDALITDTDTAAVALEDFSVFLCSR